MGILGRGPSAALSLAAFVVALGAARGASGAHSRPLVAPPGGVSVGSPIDGHLQGGARLEDAPSLRVYPCYADEDRRWGLGGLVRLLSGAAATVRRAYPDAVLSMGQLSQRGGGEVSRHASHESGRDADVGFYVANQAGKPVYAEHMVPFVADGTAPTWPGAHFDDARNWALVAALTDPARQSKSAHVSHLFVAAPLRARLMAYAERTQVPVEVRRRVSEVMAQPHGALPHDDHFHVRVSCPEGMSACIEQPILFAALARAHHPRLPLGGRLARASRPSPVKPHRTKPPTPHGAMAPQAGSLATPRVAPPQPPEQDPIDDVDGPAFMGAASQAGQAGHAGEESDALDSPDP